MGDRTWRGRAGETLGDGRIWSRRGDTGVRGSSSTCLNLASYQYKVRQSLGCKGHYSPRTISSNAADKGRFEPSFELPVTDEDSYIECRFKVLSLNPLARRP